MRACGLTPADWAAVDGLFSDRLPPLPRGLGLEVVGTVDALGEGVTGAEVGDHVLGPATFDGPTAGAAEYALMAVWARIPEGVTAEQAAALPMAAETAWRPVIATAGPTRAATLEEIGAQVTGYGDGMAERVAALAGDRVDRALDTVPTGGRVDRADQPSPAGGSLPTLIELTGDPDRVLTVSDFAAAAELGARITHIDMRYDLMGEFARLAGEGVLVVSVARTYTLGQIQEAAELSQSRRPGGKLMLVL
ncbi:alcohol dehydrogenase catalytic domain-containing protein [Nonomuraea diastatica]|uniref:alcohol dehydrogenase catalytic domain-containing protein n=1 Tax=Nonomuraea diastatica TaxID=1848329 RepID=UPI001C701A36|nr:zinc-binding dehydrogenase [Nonomuraea diastatica]